MQEETLKIGNPLKIYMEYQGWKVFKTHGNQYQMGFPDYYVMHMRFSPKWIETKIHGRPLTESQKRVFPIMLSHNVPLYIIDGDDFRGKENLPSLKRAYNKLFKPSNAALYFIPGMKGLV